MSRFLRSRAVRVSTMVGATILGAGGILFSVGVSATPAAAQQTTFQHYLCYKATAKAGFTIPPGVRLVNGFSPNGFVPTFGPANLHCNPAVKAIPGATFEITNPTWHYLCFKITAQQASNQVTVSNQFGTGVLNTKSPNDFCVPSWKSLTGPPNQSPSTPPGADHYTCYPVKYAKGSSKYTPPAPVQVQDEFSPGALTTVTVGIPQSLCVPTEKILPTGQSFPVNNPGLNYLCFKVSKTPKISPVFDENQFGTGPVTIKSTTWLCLPSTLGATGN